MTTWHGSCHCGAVRYEFDAPEIGRVTRCTCSLCRKKGILLFRVDPADLRITAGRERLGNYQFNTRVANHFFCSDCGIHVLSNPRAAPDRFVVNVNTLDDWDLETAQPEIEEFDGANWEAAFAARQAPARQSN